MRADSKVTLPPSAPSEESPRRLLGKKVAINITSFAASVIAAGMAYTVLSMVIGMALGAGALYQAERVRLATGLLSTSRDFVPAIGSGASILLSAVALSVPVGAIFCGRAAYRSSRRWLALRFTREG